MRRYQFFYGIGSTEGTVDAAYWTTRNRATYGKKELAREEMGEKDKCNQGNRDIVLNIPVTVIEVCVCGNELHQNASLYVTWSRKWTTLMLLCARGALVQPMIVFCVCMCLCALTVYHVITLYTEVVCCVVAVYVIIFYPCVS